MTSERTRNELAQATAHILVTDFERGARQKDWTQVTPAHYEHVDHEHTGVTSEYRIHLDTGLDAHLTRQWVFSNATHDVTNGEWRLKLTITDTATGVELATCQGQGTDPHLAALNATIEHHDLSTAIRPLREAILRATSRSTGLGNLGI